jgi:hypothetical protein
MSVASPVCRSIVAAWNCTRSAAPTPAGMFETAGSSL